MRSFFRRGDRAFWQALTLGFWWAAGQAFAASPVPTTAEPVAAPFWGDAENWAQIVGSSRVVGEGLPRLSEVDVSATPFAAYALQIEMFPALEPAGRAGFKAGLTSNLARLKLGVDRAVAGVLPRRGVNLSGATLPWREGLQLEAELGFRLRQPVSAAPASVEALLPLLAKCHPVVELPVTRFSGVGRPRLIDLIAANAGADRVVLGPPSTLSEWTAIDATFVSVARDGRRWLLGKAMNVEPSPLEVLLWLIEQYTALGVTITPEDLLLTGTMLPAEMALPGEYVVDFRDLGEVKFRLESPD